MSEQPTHPTTPDPVSHLVLAEALVKLLTTDLNDVPVLHDTGLTTWTFGASPLLPLHAEVGSRVQEPFDVLRACADRLGGQVTPETAFTSCGSSYRPHTLATEWSGHRLKITVLASEPSVEQELRARIADLEAQLGGGSDV